MSMLSGKAFGEAGKRIVVEEFLQGEEASFIVMTDGLHVLPLATSQDHKARDDGDKGPNTGGMGAYSPAPVVTPEIHARVMREVIEPTVAGMASEGRPYTGFLYAGLMISPLRPDQGAGVQLPLRGPGNTAHHAAPQVRSFGDLSGRPGSDPGQGPCGVG